MISDEGATAIAAVIAYPHTAIQSISLKNNQLGDKGVEILANAMDHNSTLTDLVLSHNAVGDDGARALANVIRDEEESDVLDEDDTHGRTIFNGGPNVSGMGEGNKGPAQNNSFNSNNNINTNKKKTKKHKRVTHHHYHHLHHSHGHGHGRGAASPNGSHRRIKEGLGPLALAHLDLSDNNITAVGFSALCQAVDLQPVVRKVYVRENQVSEQDVKEVFRLLSRIGRMKIEM